MKNNVFYVLKSAFFISLFIASGCDLSIVKNGKKDQDSPVEPSKPFSKKNVDKPDVFLNELETEGLLKENDTASKDIFMVDNKPDNALGFFLANLKKNVDNPAKIEEFAKKLRKKYTTDAKWIEFLNNSPKVKELFFDEQGVIKTKEAADLIGYKITPEFFVDLGIYAMSSAQLYAYYQSYKKINALDFKKAAKEFVANPNVIENFKLSTQVLEILKDLINELGSTEFNEALTDEIGLRPTDSAVALIFNTSKESDLLENLYEVCLLNKILITTKDRVNHYINDLISSNILALYQIIPLFLKTDDLADETLKLILASTRDIKLSLNNRHEVLKAFWDKSSKVEQQAFIEKIKLLIKQPQYENSWIVTHEFWQEKLK